MPELPEVETIVRTLAPRLEGRKIVRAQFPSPLVFRTDPRKANDLLTGRTIRTVRRHGKFVLMELDCGVCLAVHLGMTGKLLWDASPQGPYVRAWLELDRGRLIYDDIRQFGRIEISSGIPERAGCLGPDAVETSAEEFASLIARRRGHIKPLLLNQRFLRGLGNIYADEALFRAGIHPLADAARLSSRRVQRLHTAIQDVLRTAIAAGGSSISDYVDADGRKGSFQNSHQVYGKEGEPCARCGTAIRRIVVGQRGTHYCPKCQRV